MITGCFHLATNTAFANFAFLDVMAESVNKSLSPALSEILTLECAVEGLHQPISVAWYRSGSLIQHTDQILTVKSNKDKTYEENIKCNATSGSQSNRGNQQMTYFSFDAPDVCEWFSQFTLSGVSGAEGCSPLDDLVY